WILRLHSSELLKPSLCNRRPVNFCEATHGRRRSARARSLHRRLVGLSPRLDAQVLLGLRHHLNNLVFSREGGVGVEQLLPGSQRCLGVRLALPLHYTEIE